MTASLPDELRAFLGAVRRRWTRMVGLRTAWQGLAVAAAILVGAMTLDRVFHPHGLALVLAGGGTALLAMFAFAIAFWRIPNRPSDLQVARFVEERMGTLERVTFDDSVISAVDALERPSSSAVFLPVMLEAVMERLRALDLSRLIPSDEMRRPALLCAGSGVAFLVATVLSVPFFTRSLDAWRLQFFPGSIRIQVEPGNAKVPLGTPLHVRAAVRRSAGALTQLAPTLTVFANGQHRAVQMTAAADAFEYVIQSVDRTFSYDVSAGSARSSLYTVTMLRPPRVERIDLHYVYPSFAGLPPRDEKDGGDIYAPAGTRVHLRVHASKPIARGELALAKSAQVALRRTTDRTFEADLVLAKDDSYRIRLADGEGLVSRDEAEYFIRLMDDRPPDVRILRPSADQQITPLEEVPIEARADDDYGIGRFELVYGVAGGPEHAVPFDRITGTDIQKVGTRLLPAEDLHVKPGDVITYYARATDIGRGKRPTEATSDIFFLEVKPFNEEFVSAESQASGASDPQIESLIEGQKEIIASTWNVERRSQAARSAEDVKAIAAAQAELKARAEAQLMMRTRSRGRSPAPQQISQNQPQTRTPSGDPVATAVGAMGKAVEQLTSERTKDALAHELTALNGLLQLQAEVRRQQVSQGSAGSGFGGNRAGQDLSALFDKELRRQQRTNYETRASAEIKPDNTDAANPALDKIKELAKRQEDLNRRQRELAQSNLSPEEMKRQLEILTREQMELRVQTEELLRRLSDQANSSSRNRQGQASSSNDLTQKAESEPLRGAADEMRSAASELRRDSPGDAARSGERALNHLRRLEDQLSALRPGASGSSASDLKLEAQQVAQEQQRIASEASRLDRNASGGTADARRRLADDKDRLASRVEEMTRKAEQMAQSGGATDSKAAADAAQSLKREKIADRMRSGAREMRQEQGTVRAGTEQELAATLEQLAGRLGADGSPASSELEQTRAIRDRLQRAEQQLRDAEARARDGGARAGQSPRGSGKGQGAGAGAGETDVQRLRDEYQRELQRAQDALQRLQGGSTGDLGGATPEQHEYSRSAPGTQAFKQDRSDWESLRRNLDTALEKYEAAVSERLSRTQSKDRLSAGGSDRVPDAYSQLISRYFESLAKKK